MAEKQYEVEKVISSRTYTKKGQLKKQYRIKWKGYPTSDNTWENESDCEACQELIQEYEVSKAKKGIIGGVGDGATVKPLAKKQPPITTIKPKEVSISSGEESPMSSSEEEKAAKAKLPLKSPVPIKTTPTKSTPKVKESESPESSEESSDSDKEYSSDEKTKPKKHKDKDHKKKHKHHHHHKHKHHQHRHKKHSSESSDSGSDSSAQVKHALALKSESVSGSSSSDKKSKKKAAKTPLKSARKSSAENSDSDSTRKRARSKSEQEEPATKKRKIQSEPKKSESKPSEAEPTTPAPAKDKMVSSNQKKIDRVRAPNSDDSQSKIAGHVQFTAFAPLDASDKPEFSFGKGDKISEILGVFKKPDSDELFLSVKWNASEESSEVSAKEVRQYEPNKLLDFYETQLTFKSEQDSDVLNFDHFAQAKS